MKQYKKNDAFCQIGAKMRMFHVKHGCFVYAFARFFMKIQLCLAFSGVCSAVRMNTPCGFWSFSWGFVHYSLLDVRFFWRLCDVFGMFALCVVMPFISRFFVGFLCFCCSFICFLRFFERFLRLLSLYSVY